MNLTAAARYTALHAPARVRSALARQRVAAKPKNAVESEPTQRNAHFSRIEDLSGRLGREDANRRLLRRLNAWRRGEQLQAASVLVVAALLDCLEEGAGDQCAELLASHAYEAALDRWLSRLDFTIATDAEWIELFPENSEGIDGGETALPGWARVEVRKFRTWARKRGHSGPRVTASIRRFLGPFCQHRRTSGIELSWKELRKVELRRAVRAGLDVERAWLSGSPAHEREPVPAPEAPDFRMTRGTAAGAIASRNANNDRVQRQLWDALAVELSGWLSDAKPRDDR